MHQFHINSLSQSSDCESIISSDDTTVTMWNTERSAQPSKDDLKGANYFNLIDKAPKLIHDLSEVITHSQFHPTDSQQFLLASSKGYVEIYDMRTCTKLSKSQVIQCKIRDYESTANPFCEIVNSISCAKFLEHSTGHYIASRDYLNVKMWDLRMPLHFV